MFDNLNLHDFEVVNDTTPRDGETPQQWVQRMTGRDIPEMNTLTWDDVHKINTDALNRNVTSPFANILMRTAQPSLILRKKP